jgi:predicted O-methyltransferase YrrM
MIDEIARLTRPESLKVYDTDFLEESDYGEWSIEKDTARFIGRVCEKFKPRRVLEFGTGLSTLILANEASKGNVERIWSVDHLADFPGHPRETLKTKGKDRFVRFCKFPLRLRYTGGKLILFYSIPKGFFDAVKPLDLVIVDGPPYYYNGREAALYTVYPYLSARSLVLLDDANRKEKEQVYLENWKRYFGRNIDSAIFLNEFKKGLACVWPTGDKSEVSPFGLGTRLKDSGRAIKSASFKLAHDFKRIISRGESI